MRTRARGELTIVRLCFPQRMKVIVFSLLEAFTYHIADRKTHLPQDIYEAFVGELCPKDGSMQLVRPPFDHSKTY